MAKTRKNRTKKAINKTKKTKKGFPKKSFKYDASKIHPASLFLLPLKN